MKDKTQATFLSRAAQVRKIAKGIYDPEERRILLQFVEEVEKAAKKPRLRQP